MTNAQSGHQYVAQGSTASSAAGEIALGYNTMLRRVVVGAAALARCARITGLAVH
jgi:hypothetical protein